MADDDCEARPPMPSMPSMRALLAACDAARALSTPPIAPRDDDSADRPGSPPERDDQRDAA